ncbi:MAG: hypothetical protein EPN93_08230 [Spirochaetes bacterium]|nr:MAG: hypothetical protein EPN93_08230 [Spirochaetota bacterium]
MTAELDARDRYLILFGLPEDYSLDELGAAYRALAKLNHPDVNPDPSSGMRMAIVNEAYRFLHARHGAPRTPPAGPAKPRDECYEIYRDAFDTLKSAFRDYFGEGPDKARVNDLSCLRERLAAARRGFARLVDELPYNAWTSDAIDRILSINTWLGENKSD